MENNMSRVLKFRNVETEENSASAINSHLDRIKRNRDQVRYSNSSGFMYCFVVQKINDLDFYGHIAGPDTDKSRLVCPLSVKFLVTQNIFGECQIRIISRDKYTPYESAIKLSKHAIKKIIKSLEKKPQKFSDGLSKTHWDGFFLSYSGKENNLKENFEETFNDAIAQHYFPNDFKETCKNIGFNIESQQAGIS